ncbi:SecDF P1 head subdomain-containing protein [Dactylosporangium sp. CS-047395]|uniref:SecDF P1 head subdomain-containing protein n=1 Tax=Dactylosporangium sp. CS-047395 TaxID=3239936 RepID=UPI003D8D873A
MSLPPVVVGRPRSTPTWFWFVIGFVVLMLIAGAITAAVFLTARFGGGARSGDVAYTLRVAGEDGRAPDDWTMEETRRILQDRLRTLDVDRPHVDKTAADTLRVTAAHDDAGRVKAVLEPGHLTFRKVLDQTPIGAATADCQAGVQVPGDAGGPLASAKAKLGDATYAAAAALTEPDDPAGARLTGFDKLTCAEVAALPAGMQYNVPGVSCTMLGHRPAGVLADGEAVTACDDRVKYRLDVAKVTGAELAGAEAGTRADIGSYVVKISFTPAGQGKWTDLTREALERQVAILVDDEVVSAPMIQGVIPGDAEISGGALAERDGATSLAATLSSGALPAQVTITATGTVA